jgi:hypothetical protein
MKKDLVCQEEFDHKLWGAVPMIIEGMYRVGCLFDKSALLNISFYIINQ